MRTQLLAILLSVLAATAAGATTIHVPGDADSIAHALYQAEFGDSVLVAPGLYLEAELMLTDGVTLRGAGEGPEAVVIDAQQQGRVLHCSDAGSATRLENLTLTGGVCLGLDHGAGLVCEFAALQATDLIIRDNDAKTGGGSGGGIFCLGSAPEFRRCVVAGNRAVDGGGADLSTGSAAHFVDCLFVGNTAQFWGGGLSVRNDCAPLIEGCTLAGNRAYEGGGIWAVGESHAAVSRSIIALSPAGGGLHIDAQDHESTIALDCCDVFGNVGGGYAGNVPDQTGQSGNIAADPYFCDSAAGDFELANLSPCLPAHNACAVQMGAYGAGCLITAAAPAPAALALGASPNPFNPRTALTLHLESAGPARLAIFDLAGRCVAVLSDGERTLPAGETRLVWEARDGAGRPLPSGVYLARLEAAGELRVAKLVLLK